MKITLLIVVAHLLFSIVFFITKKLNKFIIAGRIPNQPNIRINNY